jgi:AGZA family xanthine/uracil permease-like MFS transporter
VNRIARYFEFEQLGTSFRRECLAGLTTFLAMAYILFVNPAVLSLSDVGGEAAALGMPRDAVFTATALAAALGCLMMGIIARYPIALAPGMGLNAFFAYTVVLGMGIPWQTALCGTIISGCVFLLLSVTGARERVVNAIPLELKHAVAAGVGLFIAFIGLQNAGIIVDDDVLLVSLGPFESAGTLLAVFGVVVTVILLSLGVRSGIFLGMVATAAAGLVSGQISPPERLVGAVPGIGETFGVAFTRFEELLSWDMTVVILTMLFVDFFDTTGTIMAVANQAGLTRDNRLPRAGRALSMDAAATLISGIIGTSSTTSYIESASGVAAGGRSGFTAVVVGLLFLAALWFSPLLAVVTSAVTAPALIVVGGLMVASLKDIAWDRFEIALPAFLTMLMMPLTFSVATGIAIGFMMYALSMVAARRGSEVHPVMYVLAVLFLLYLAFLQ